MECGILNPLRSLKILDFSTLLPGPFATMMLADMGADVLRVEAPNRPDMIRLMPPYDGDTSAWHGVLNRSKRSIGLDLKQPAGVAIVNRLITDGGYDIILEQFRPGVMDRLGIGYETLSTLNPGLIYCSLTGYGQTGPYRDRAGHDNNYTAVSGMMSYSGRKTGGVAPVGVQIADVGGGSLGAMIGLLAAVIQRQHGGLGQRVDISMLDMIIAWQSHIMSEYLVGGQIPERENMPLNGGRVYDFYETSDGRFLSVGSLEPKFWQGFCETIGRADLIMQGYNQDPAAQRGLRLEIGDELGKRPLAEWVDLFAAVDVCVEPLLTVPEAINHPQTQARQMIVDVPKPNGGSQKQVGSPIKFSAGQPTYKHIGVPLGAHTDEVLGEIGYAPNQIDELRADGVLG